MKVNELEAMGFTRAEILAALLGREGAPATTATPAQTATPEGLAYVVGVPCVIRCQREGVHVGVVRSVTPTAAGGVVVLEPGSVRLWSWRAGGGGRTLSAVAEHGIIAPSRTETAAHAHVLLEACGIEPCSDAAWASIQGMGWQS